jgi:hypothetical protein
MTGFIILIIVLVGGAAFIVQQTKAHGRWGLGSFRGINCPRCGTHLPMIRKPATTEQMLWGGWTCPNCGCKVDKYGREITS